jgi:hypothetical protein
MADAAPSGPPRRDVVAREGDPHDARPTGVATSGDPPHAGRDEAGAARPPLARMPTLTEVIELGTLPARAPSGPQAGAPADGSPSAGEAEIVDAVMRGVQRHLDLTFEARVREAMAPLLARLADGLLHEARDGLAAALRDIVARAVAQELAQRRKG